MAAHRYWALDVYSGSWVSMRNMEMRTSPGGADATGGGASFGSVNQYMSGGTDNAFDHNDSTVWGSAAAGWRRIGYDFVTPVDIVEIVVRSFSYSGYPIQAAAVSYSDDGVSFTTLGPLFGTLNAVDGEYTLSGFVDCAARVISGDARAATAWPTDVAPARVSPSTFRWDALDSGPLEIAGIVEIKDSPNIPVSRRVRLFDQQSARLVREMWSAADGTYSFKKLKDAKYFLVSHDHTLIENATASDQISPEVPA